MPELPEHEVRYVAQYVESQIRDADDPVTLVQKVGSRRVAHLDHDLYDVWTAKGDRWWVITNLTNLYNQADFHSVEQAFTYHLGVDAILRERSRAEMPDDGQGISAPWRKFMKALDAMSDATEAEDYQAVAIRCREALLAYVRSHNNDVWVPSPQNPPQSANFKAWMDIFAEFLAESRPRAYLKSLADRTWDLTVWLQHYAGASEWDAEMVIDATSHVLSTFDLAILRHQRGAPERCPQCDSYRVSSDGEVAERDGRRGWWSQDVCSACEWRGPETFKPYPNEDVERDDLVR